MSIQPSSPGDGKSHLPPTQDTGVTNGIEAQSELILGRLISTPETPNLFLQHFRLNSGKNTTAGRMVAVEAVDHHGVSSLILARVNNVREFNPHEDVQSSKLREVLPIESRYPDEEQSTVIYRVAEIEPLEEAILGPDGEVTDIHPVESLPRSGAAVIDAGPELTIQALGLEPDPDEGIHVGIIHGNPAIPVVLNKGTIQRHILIVGGIGSGKSYTRGVLAEELYRLGIPQINVDVMGEMIEATEQLGGRNVVPGKKGFSLPLSALTADDVIEAIPGINRSTNIAILIAYAHERLLKERTITRGQHFMVNDLVKKIEEVAPDLKMEAAGTLRPAIMRAQSLDRLSYIGDPFDWKNSIKPGAVINVDCRGLLVSDLRLIVASIARDLQRLAASKQIPFVLFSMDEFHLVAPPREEGSVTTQVLREIARIGRHYKIGLILTTQSPSDVDRSILKRLLTRFLHAIEPDQLDSLRGVFSDASDELVRQLPKMPVGTCVLTGAAETVKHATMIDVRRRETTHGGGTPDIWAELKDSGWSGKRALPRIKKAKE